MDTSDSSSEDDCNVYINAAHKLSVLNSKSKLNINKKHEDEVHDTVLISEEPKSVNSNTDNIEEIINKSIDDIIYVEDLDEAEEENEPAVVISDNEIICTDEPIRRYNTRSRSTRNVNKSNEARNTKKKRNTRFANNMDDSIERELNMTCNDSLDLSQEEDNNCVVIGSPIISKKTNIDDYEVSVKVLWMSNKVERFQIRRHETLQKIFQYFATLEGVPEGQIHITKRNKRISPFDTPASIDWSITDILDGGVISAEIAKKKNANSKEDEEQENACKIKVQTMDKRTFTVILKNDETITVLAQACSKELSIPESKMKFYFDGELLDTDETPESLDLDGEACIDLKISK